MVSRVRSRQLQSMEDEVSPALTGGLNELGADGHYSDTCTFVAPLNTSDPNACYTYRTCQSCLQTKGCVVNDYGMCSDEKKGSYHMHDRWYDYFSRYSPSMNYLNAFPNNLALPNATTTNADGLKAEQNWHFRAGEAKYCAASDPICQECKANEFWRPSGPLVLPDSRFCVGQDGCVCIQTCETHVYRPESCQYRIVFTDYRGDPITASSERTYPIVQPKWWVWLVFIAFIFFVRSIFECSLRERNREKRLGEARKTAVQLLRQELSTPEDQERAIA